MFLAGILGSFEQDLLFLLVALVLFGKRLPEVASGLGRKVYQFRRGLDEMKSEITKPIREQIEAPLREVAETARRASEDAQREVRSTAESARSDFNASVARAGSPDQAVVPVAAGSAAPPANPFPYPRAPRGAPEAPEDDASDAGRRAPPD